MSTNLPSFESAQELWGMGQLQLIQLLMHFWGLYQALLQKHECLEKKSTKVIDFDGKSAPQTDSDKIAIAQGRVAYLEIENQMLKQKLAQQQTLLAQQQAQIAQQQAQIAHLHRIVQFWMYLAKETSRIAKCLLHYCKKMMYDPITLENDFSENSVLCVGLNRARAFITGKDSAKKIQNQKHPFDSQDKFIEREFPELSEMINCAKNTEQSLQDLQNFYRSNHPNL